MGFIRNFINKKEEEIIRHSNIAVDRLGKELGSFVKKDTYLIYDFKANLLNLIKDGNTQTKIPWYLFWDFRLKSKLQNNLAKLEKFDDDIINYNPEFVNKKKKEYKDLFKRETLVLDDDQQTAIITDDKHNLVVAGAGSGKTEVLITRIAYLLKRKSDTIKSNRILALAFQNKAASEMRERLQKRYNSNVEIRTFHSLGKKIIEDKVKSGEAPKLKPEC